MSDEKPRTFEEECAVAVKAELDNPLAAPGAGDKLVMLRLLYRIAAADERSASVGESLLANNAALLAKWDRSLDIAEANRASVEEQTRMVSRTAEAYREEGRAEERARVRAAAEALLPEGYGTYECGFSDAIDRALAIIDEVKP